MALTNDAGKKKAVGLARNLFAETPMESNPSTETKTVAEMIAPMKTLETAINPPAGASSRNIESTAKSQSGRTRKLSFLATSEMEARFKKARLRGGFETIEDAYNEALRLFCEGVEKGSISNF
jgi:hypothetical protein